MANRYPLIVDSSSENIKELPAGDGLLFADNDKIVIGTGTDLNLYHDGTNSYITNATGALKIATETSGIALTIGHTTSETTVADNLTVTGNFSVGGNFDVTGTLDFSDSAISNVGDISLDSISGDSDSDTAITFSGSNVITVKAANADQVTFIDGAIVPSTDNDIDLGTSSVEFKDAFFDGTVTSDAFAGPLTGAVTGNADTATTLATARTIGGVSFDGSANIAVTLAATATALASARTIGGTSFDGTANIVPGTATLATTVTVTDNAANTNYPVVYHNGSNALLDHAASLNYNPGTEILSVPTLDIGGNIDVDGTANLDNTDIDGTLNTSGVVTCQTSANISQVAITSSSNAIAWDAEAAANAYHVTTENTTFSAPSNATEGAIISVEIAQGGTARTVAWNTVFEFAASTAPTITATANKTDILTFRYNGSVWQEIGRVQNMAQT